MNFEFFALVLSHAQYQSFAATMLGVVLFVFCAAIAAACIGFYRSDAHLLDQISQVIPNKGAPALERQIIRAAHYMSGIHLKAHKDFDTSTSDLPAKPLAALLIEISRLPELIFRVNETTLPMLEEIDDSFELLTRAGGRLLEIAPKDKLAKMLQLYMRSENLRRLWAETNIYRLRALRDCAEQILEQLDASIEERRSPNGSNAKLAQWTIADQRRLRLFSAVMQRNERRVHRCMIIADQLGQSSPQFLLTLRQDLPFQYPRKRLLLAISMLSAAPQVNMDLHTIEMGRLFAMREALIMAHHIAHQELMLSVLSMHVCLERMGRIAALVSRLSTRQN